MIELGDKDVCANLPVKYPRSVEALGLEKFIALIPQYPMSTTDFELDNEWRDFKESINVEEEKLATQIIALKVNAEAYTAKVLIQKNQKAFLNPLNNPVYQTAQCKLFALAEWQHDRMIRFGQKLEHSIDTVDKMKDAYRKSIEGISCPSTQATAFMVAANTIWHDVQTEWVKFQKLINTEFISHYMFAALDPSLFELEKAEIKRGFLALLGGLYYEFEPVCTNAQQNNVHQSKVLPDFDELNCKYKDDIWIPGWRFTIECNKMTTECDLVIIKGKQVENLNTNEIIEGSVEFGVFKTLGAKHMGPVTAEIKAELGAFIEYDNSGIADIGIAGGVKAEIGFTNPHQLEEMLEVHTKKLGPIAIGTTPSVIVAGAEVKVGWNTSHGHFHSAVHSTGIFGGGGHGGH